MAHLTGTDEADHLIGEAADDTIEGLNGNDTLDGGLGSDLLVGGEGDDDFNRPDPWDGLLPANGADTLVGGTGSDSYFIDDDDVVIEDADATEFNFDIVVYVGAGEYQTPENVEGMHVRGTTSKVTTNADGVWVIVFDDDDSGVEVVGLGGADQIFGDNGDDVLRGGGGTDQLTGAGGDNSLLGGDGDDQIVCNFEDFSAGSGPFANRAFGEAGDDRIIGSPGSGGADYLSGGDGLDIISFKTGAQTANGGAGSDAFNFADIAKGDQVVEDFTSGEDHLVFRDASQVDSIVQDGADALITWHGVITEPGDDTLLDGGTVRLIGVEAASLGAEDFLALYGGQVTTGTATGTEASEMMVSRGAVVLRGLGGDDQLVGFDSRDTLDGGNGNDTLIGAGGNDVLRGRGGADVFMFSSLSDGRDRIKDFDAAHDTIDISAIDAKPRAGDQAFHFVPAFGGHRGEALLAYDAAHDRSVLRLDANGDGRADFMLMIDGHVGPDAHWVL